ncbi:hypothetical protein, partial [Muribaculum sp.]
MIGTGSKILADVRIG